MTRSESTRQLYIVLVPGVSLPSWVVERAWKHRPTKCRPRTSPNFTAWTAAAAVSIISYRSFVSNSCRQPFFLHVKGCRGLYAHPRLSWLDLVSGGALSVSGGVVAVTVGSVGRSSSSALVFFSSCMYVCSTRIIRFSKCSNYHPPFTSKVVYYRGIGPSKSDTEGEIQKIHVCQMRCMHLRPCRTR